MFEISRFNPCERMLEFRARFDTFEQAWNASPRGDVMLELATRLNIDHKILTKAKVCVARTVRHKMKDQRSNIALNIAQQYCDGKAPKSVLDVAYLLASAAAEDSISYDAAAHAAAEAVRDADAAATGGVAADAARAAGCPQSNQLETANICRLLLTKDVLKKIKKL